MFESTYQCYSCGWSGDDPEIEEMDECWQIEKGVWKHYPSAIHYICPECQSIFSILVRE